MAVNTYGLREVADLTFYDLTTNKPFLYMDYALTSNNEHSSDTTYLTGGKGNPRRLSFDGNKQSTLEISTQIIDFRIIALLAGAEVQAGATNVFKREVKVGVTTTGVTITLSKTPVANTVTVFALSEDAEAGKEKVISISGSTVTITGGVAGTEYVVYYQFQSEVTAEKISFKSTNFPKYCKIVGDTLIKNEATGVNEPFQMVANKAKAQGNFTLAMASEGDPTTLNIMFDLFVNDNDEFISYVKYA